jgi:transcriptional regulator with XRE-family HTH domain
MEAKKKRLTRSQYSPFKRRCELLRMQKGITMEKMALDLEMFIETQDGTRKGQQARLSQYENRPDGPPWDIVVQYADYFGLKGVERFDFFIEALSSAKKITVDVEKVKGVDKDVFIRFLAGILTFDRPICGAGAAGPFATNKVDDIEKLIKEVFPMAFIAQI